MIVALDVENVAGALQLVEKIGSAANFYKVGMELYAAAGMEIVSQLSSFGKNVFLDLKLYDIAETVRRATRQICKNGAPDFLTVHGSRTIMQAAVEGRGDSQTKLLGVTVLTSFDQEDLADLGFSVPVGDLVELRVRKAVESGIDGVVCSPLEIARVRQAGGPKLSIVTPGVRSSGADAGGQKRVATPAEAIRNGADYLVIGRQVTRAANPEAACQEILAELGSVARGA
ncbi:MAG: orotidine-5'-phosphate decarboxylase [Bryobacteraceae bacterium]